MADAHASVVDLSRLDREALEALVVAQQEKPVSGDNGFGAMAQLTT
jgi:hypothetical protein